MAIDKEPWEELTADDYRQIMRMQKPTLKAKSAQGLVGGSKRRKTPELNPDAKQGRFRYEGVWYGYNAAGQLENLSEIRP